MSGTVRRNSPGNAEEAVRGSLLSMRYEDLWVPGEPASTRGARGPLPRPCRSRGLSTTGRPSVEIPSLRFLAPAHWLAVGCPTGLPA